MKRQPIKRKKIFSNHTSDKYPIHARESYNSIAKNKKPNLNMGKGPEIEIFPKKTHKW